MSIGKFFQFASTTLALAMSLLASHATAETTAARAADYCRSDGSGKRMVCADIAAIDQLLVYNRFGSFNPYGMMFALRRDLSRADTATDTTTVNGEAVCSTRDGTEPGVGNIDKAGEVRLKDCKRPRPLVLRANVGDVLHLRVTNLLMPSAPDVSRNVCPPGKYHAQTNQFKTIHGNLSFGDSDEKRHGEVLCDQSSGETGVSGDWPETRGLNIAIQGLAAIPAPNAREVKPACLGLEQIPTGKFEDCYFSVDREGTYFMSSKAAPSGGEGNGGSITHGLFGAVIAERENTQWFRSQASRAAFDKAWSSKESNLATRLANGNHARSGSIDYNKVNPDNGIPYLAIARQVEAATTQMREVVEIVHSDLNAIIFRPADPENKKESLRDEVNFREFSVFFHDELKTSYTKNFEELGKFGQLAGARDGFAINYGASGMGAMLLANRKQIGPAAGCIECLYEEFFLASWANGDPALLEEFSDDPSNVHHSYLNDRIVFRNFHAGPKETHVFHLHDHQWFAGNDGNRGAYLDSQTVGPEQGFTYEIYHGGAKGNSTATPAKGWWETLGAGNRNRSPGDSIFHCHLYPHFAQGMWELWRNHDVLEDGTRVLADGQLKPGLSLEFVADPTAKRLGSVGANGEWLGSGPSRGTPVPAVVPLPNMPLPLLPSYKVASEQQAGFPGYPYYIAGQPGHRPPQPPLDMAMAKGSDGKNYELNGGLPRHVITGGEREFSVHGIDAVVEAFQANKPEAGKLAFQYVAKVLALGDFTADFKTADIKLLQNDGELLERAGMGFHYNGNSWGDSASLKLLQASGDPSAFKRDEGGYKTQLAPSPFTLAGTPGPTYAPYFLVNGSKPKPGAPFADPCAVAEGLVAKTDDLFTKDTDGTADGQFSPDPKLTNFRRYEVSAVQLDLVTNRAGWHDPQARINVLTQESHTYKNKKRGAGQGKGNSAEPFFFRALSGECIEFRHTNELPKDLDLDDFQVRTPTDTIGQHIHLVKFDVIASDGSGNGWNYEDGTFAPDEVVARICASSNVELSEARGRFCETGMPRNKGIYWKEDLLADPSKGPGDAVNVERRKQLPFQTTVQRWFADPIISGTGLGDYSTVDRTMRTVFTHDHFGPSSIQQHGFYSALIIEPRTMRVCGAENEDKCTSLPANLANIHVNDAVTGHELKDDEDGKMVGAAKILEEAREPDEGVFAFNADDKNAAAIHPNFREFALAIADFATLYDPREWETAGDVARRYTSGTADPDRVAGLERLACEALYRNKPAQLNGRCGSKLQSEKLSNSKQVTVFGAAEDFPPAWVAGGMTGDLQKHVPPAVAPATTSDIIKSDDVTKLRERLIAARKMDPGCAGSACKLARPVSAPGRPESISVDHHDPYLVNYRGEPLPLRIGGHRKPWTIGTPRVETCTKAGSNEKCSVNAQRPDEHGDMANVFLSSLHGDPATPVLEAYSGDRVIMRLIQGAQEVQHTFNIEGYSWRRNLDQVFPAAARMLETTANLTAHQKCLTDNYARDGRPTEYRNWFEQRGNYDSVWWGNYARLLPECDNLEGFTTAQEVGISEHFEFRGSFRQANAGGALEALVGNREASRLSTDYLYDFGTLDAIWNGAWGLIRVYANGQSVDVTACGNDQHCTEQVGKRLVKVREPPEGLNTDVAEAVAKGTFVELPSQCPAGVTPRWEAVAAIEGKSVWPGKVGSFDYGFGHYDPDGIFLARLDPSKLLPSGALNDDGWFGSIDKFGQPADVSKWNSVTRRAVLDQIRQSYNATGPTPLSLTVKAGDCVNIALVNMLTEDANSRYPKGLRDRLGDALMPKIVPLNVDSAFECEEAHGATSPICRLDAVRGKRSQTDIRPSARLSLSLALPALTGTGSMALPFGYNELTSLAPAGSKLRTSGLVGVKKPASGKFQARTESVELLRFYAGRSFANDKDLYKPMLVAWSQTHAAKDILEWAKSRLIARGTAASDLANLRFAPADKCSSSASVPGSVAMPESYCAVVLAFGTGTGEFLDKLMAGATISEVCPQLPPVRLSAWCANALLQASWKNSLREMVAQGNVTHWVPYAFGPLAIKSTSDMINHGTHGLFGAIDVIPSNWETRTNTFKSEALNETFVSQVANGNETRKIRKLTLFYRDGLALRDRESKTAWVVKGAEHKNALDNDGTAFAGKPVPDCPICDDTYDFGEKAVNYKSASFYAMLRQYKDAGGNNTQCSIEPGMLTNLNTCNFPSSFFTNAKTAGVSVMRAEEGDEVVIRVLHPGGRARQRSFTTIGQDYDDLYPSFGFPHSALLAPGKSVAAALAAPVKEGCYLWVDGTAPLRSGGTWGLLDVAAPGSTASSCAPSSP